MKKRTLIKALLISAILLAVLFASAWFFVSWQLSHLENCKESITAAVGRQLNRDITYEKGEATLTLRAGLALQFTRVVIREKDRTADLLNIENAFFRVDILPLLRKRMILREIILDQPRLSLKRDQAGALNIADLLTKEQKPEIALEFRKLTIEKGSVTFFDQAVSNEGLVTSLTNLYCRIDTPHWGGAAPFSLKATVGEDKNQGVLALAGTFHPAPLTKPFAESTVDVSLRLNGTDIHHYRPYLNNHIPLEQLAGRLDMATTFSGTLLSFTAKGSVTVKDALLHYPQVFRGPVQPSIVQVDYALTRNAAHLQLDIARLAVDRFEAKGNLDIREMDREDPLLSATAVTSTFSLKESQPYIPWGIIPKTVGRFIETHIKEGNFRLLEGKLNGRRSQIVQIERQENAGVLSIRAEVNKGVFVVDNKTPAFQDISGIMELINRQFLLKNMTGRFGASPCTLEGGISDFALPQPAHYTAAMTLQPAREEILWLLGKERFRNLSFNGASTLFLSGTGPAENYRIGARWDLTSVAYAYPEVLKKPQGKSNRLAAEITLNKNAVTVSSFNYDLPPVKVSGSAGYRFAGKTPLSLNVQSNAFDIRDVVSLLPVLRAYDPAGNCLIDIKGRGDIQAPASFQWKGNVSLTDVSWQPSGNIKPVKGLTGKVVFGGNTMETSQFNARIGDSAIAGKCRMNDFHKSQLDCQFAAPLFRSTDVGWQSPEGAVNFQDVKGQIFIEDNHIRVDKLSLRLGKSGFNLLGDIRDFAAPRITLALHSPYTDSEDIARLLTLKNPQQKDDSSSRVELIAHVEADAGNFQGVDFNKLSTRLKYAGGILNVETLEAGFFEGNLQGKGQVDIRPDGQNRYQANFSLDRISLDKIQGFLEMGDRTVTGNLSLTGEVTATGRNGEDFKKTAAGTFQIRAEKGVLKKFSVLSKIFSLLNVFQLAKFQLPDMAKGGMPYNSITGAVSLRDGILSSENFFIDSDAMQISGVGKIDLLKEGLDNIVGVHPLHTLDRIVAKIPIAGWLITDERGHLITVHFQVDGTWDDPQVTPIPAQSLAKGTMDIFRRLFQLPAKLITDTGEVLLGR